MDKKDKLLIKCIKQLEYLNKSKRTSSINLIKEIKETLNTEDVNCFIEYHTCPLWEKYKEGCSDCKKINIRQRL